MPDTRAANSTTLKSYLMRIQLMYSACNQSDPSEIHFFQKDGLNPGGFLPNARCLGLEEMVARSSPSHPSAQPYLSHVSGEIGPWPLPTILPAPICH